MAGSDEESPASERRIGKTWRLLIGKPLRSSESSKEQINPVEGLSALSLDALTSVAYGPEAMLVVLALGGAQALHLILPITIAIVLLLALLVTSYRQVIEAFPGGGGAYAVSKAHLGENVSLVAAASLVVDYTLTVAVSIAAGVAALTSAYPGLIPETVPICLAILVIITFMNLRGLGETARAFLLPTLIFILGLFAVIFIGLMHPLALNSPTVARPIISTGSVQTIGILLILKAFSAGCSALTGVEAIANGVPLFKEPRVTRAKSTELLLGVILGGMLIGLAILADRWHIAPMSGQTVLSQIMAVSIGTGWPYYALSITITMVLGLAANTSFGGLPVLASLLSRDNFLPHRFSLRGDRQVLNTGIWALTIMSGVLLVAVNGDTNTLIPLFAIGVFTGFTLSQAGLVINWVQKRPPHWSYRALINGLGAVVTAIATIVFLVTKFSGGAWIVLIAVPAFIVMFKRIHIYYQRVGKELSLDLMPGKPMPQKTTVIIPISQISKLTQSTLSEALSISKDVVAVYVVNKAPSSQSSSEGGQSPAQQILDQWNSWDPGARLEILESDFASIVEPIVEFIDEMRRQSDHQLVVLIPVVVPDRFRYRILHNHTDLLLSSALSNRPDLIVARAKYPLSKLEKISPGK
ncbi:MAG: APC family permease [Acidimicrobiaceae bacterium]|nr:APC family permease [Acidimicrobiaceae bacterium]